MKKIGLGLVSLILLKTSIGFSQNSVIIRYVDTEIQTPIRITGYLFSSGWEFEEFVVKDSIFHKFIQQRIDSIKYCRDNSIQCRFPDVRQQIIVTNGEEYDILSSDGSFAMEINGKPIIFDKPLQRAIHRAIEAYEDKKGGNSANK